MQDSENPFVSYRQFLLNRHGKYLRRIPINLDLGCPHRTASAQNSGCIYCSNSGARASYLNPSQDLETQVKRSIAFNLERYHPDGFMAYFQSFTSTNAPVEKLAELYERVLKLADFEAILISTRPDCLPEETVDYLQELQKKYDVWIELGIQTVHDRTLDLINRGHDFACARDAVERLAKHNLNVAAHIILGLPGELPNDFRATATVLSELPLSGIKIHNLHVLKNTPLAQWWRQGRIVIHDEHEYAEILMDFIRRIPPEWPLMRIVADSPRSQLLAPKWWLNKHEFQDYVCKQMQQRGWKQGDIFRGIDDEQRYSFAIKSRKIVNVLETTAQKVYQFPHQLLNRLSLDRSSPVLDYMPVAELNNGGRIPVLDVGLGLGKTLFHPMNFLQNLPMQVNLTTLAPDPKALENFGYDPGGGQWQTLLEYLTKEGTVSGDWGKWRLYRGDPRRRLHHIRGKARIILLQPVPIEKYVEFYSFDFLARLIRHLALNGVLISPVRAGAFRSALHRLGMVLGTVGRDSNCREGTVAAFDSNLITHPLEQRQIEILNATVSGALYRDPKLIDSRKKILHRHKQLVARLKSRGWPSRLH